MDNQDSHRVRFLIQPPKPSTAPHKPATRCGSRAAPMPVRMNPPRRQCARWPDHARRALPPPVREGRGEGGQTADVVDQPVDGPARRTGAACHARHAPRTASGAGQRHPSTSTPGGESEAGAAVGKWIEACDRKRPQSAPVGRFALQIACRKPLPPSRDLLV